MAIINRRDHQCAEFGAQRLGTAKVQGFRKWLGYLQQHEARDGFTSERNKPASFLRRW